MADDRLRGATVYASHIVARHLLNGRVFIPELHPELAEIDDLFEPIYRQELRPASSLVEPSPHVAGFSLTRESYDLVRVKIQQRRAVADHVIEKVISQILFREPMDPQMAQLAQALLRQEFKASAPNGRHKQQDRDALICGLIENIGKDFGFQHAWNRMTSPIPLSGALIVAEVLVAFGGELAMSAEAVREAFDSGKAAKARAKKVPNAFLPLHRLPLAERLKAFSAEYNNHAKARAEKAYLSLTTYS